MQPNITTKKYVQRHLKLYTDAKYFIFHLTQVMHASTHSQQRYTVLQFITWWREIFRKGRWYFVGIAAITAVAQALLPLWQTALTESNMFTNGFLTIFTIVLLSLLLIAGYLVLTYMALYLIKYLSLGQSFTLKTLREDTHKNFVWLFVTSILKGIFTIGLLILLIIPGLIYSVYWLFNQFVNVYENVFYTPSLSQSYSLIKGRWRKTVGNLAIILLMTMVFYAVFAPFLGQNDIKSSSTISTPMWNMMWYARGTDNEWLNMLRAILSGTFSMFLLCVMAKMYLAYKETSTEGGMITHAHAHAHEPQHPHHEHEHTSHTHTWHEHGHTSPHTHHEEHTHEHHSHTEHVATTKPAPKKSTPKPRVKKESDTASS